jgi:PAS domain S-box-containing protein
MAQPTESAMPGGEALLRAILDSASQAILTVDRRGTIVSVNTKSGEVFGYPTEEMVGQPVEMLLPDGARAGHNQHRSNYFSSPRVRPMGLGMDLSARRKDGTEFPVEISLSYIESDHEPLAIAFVSDITGRKRLEEQLVHSQKMEAVGRLAGGIAHDFNNLLTIISGYDRLMLNALSPQDSMRGYAEEIARAAERATALTKQLLAFSRRQIIQPKVLNLNAIVDETQTMLRRLLGENTKLVAILQPTLGFVRADRSQFEQVLFNLAVNARDAMPQGGTITIETCNVDLDADYAKTHLGVQPGPYVMMAVTDTGIGMDAETRRHIFEPFFTTKPADQGTGLGLATVYGIVKQNGGDIWVYSEIGKGTTFKVYLPRVDGETQAQTSPAAAGEPRRGTETILVVEDEKGVRQLIVTVLKQHGYRVLEAGDSLEAVQVSEKHQGDIALLITDVIMPHSSGRDLADRLLVARPSTKVLYISGYTENTILHHGVLESNIDFLAKPFAFETLLDKVREMINR